MFVGCLAGDVPRLSSGFVEEVPVCLTHPVDGKEYIFGNLVHAWPYAHLCWRFCGSAAVHPPMDNLAVPRECFETEAPQ